ncbi:MAG: biotin--[acetyl-CoA-carboxylase] ligase [Myxococcota bacterium]
MLHWVDETSSTNADLAARARDLPHGSGLAARRQTAGRGRLGRTWAEASGNLYLSVLLKDVVAAELPLVTLGAGVVVVDAVGEGFQLKWPNDVLDRAGRKLAGVLCEASWEQGRLAHVVVGIGVNVVAAPEGVPATCLADHGVHTDADTLAERIRAGLVGLDRPSVLRAWSERSCTLGRDVQVEGVRGRAVGLGPDGALLVDTGTGVERVITGDVGFL